VYIWDTNACRPNNDEEERWQLRAEIDAATLHAYGLDPGEMQFVLDNIHLVDNSRLMNHESLKRVSVQSHELA